MLLHTSILNTIHSHPMSRGDLPAKQPRKYDLTLDDLQKMPSAFSGSKPFGLLHHQKNENLTGGENCLFHHTECMSIEQCGKASHHLRPLMRSLFGGSCPARGFAVPQRQRPQQGRGGGSRGGCTAGKILLSGAVQPITEWSRVLLLRKKKVLSAAAHCWWNDGQLKHWNHPRQVEAVQHCCNSQLNHQSDYGHSTSTALNCALQRVDDISVEYK